MKHFFRTVVIILCLSVTSLFAQAVDPGQLTRNLKEFGPTDSKAAAEATFSNALETMSEATGGVLIVPDDVPISAVLENTERWSHSVNPESADLRDWKVGPGVLVVDLRGGNTTLRVPQLTQTNNRGGIVLNRVMRMKEGDSLQHWTEEGILSIENDIIHGPVNYLDWIVAPVKAGKDARFYVPQVRNIFPGMYLNAHGGPGYRTPVARITVKTVGYDNEKKLYYFTADTPYDHTAGAIVQNKSHTPAIRIQNNLHASNQTFDFYMDRHQYGNGDSYMVATDFNYMGNVHSMAGDENGVNFAAFIKSDTSIFRATVKAYDAESDKLVFEKARNAHTIGNSRPLINLNPQKWVTQGTVMIVPAESYWDTVDTGKYTWQGKSYPTTIAPVRGSEVNGLRMGGLMRFSADAPLTRAHIGWFFSVDEESEYVPASKEPTIRRWYEITDIAIHDDGTKDMLIQRHWWGAKDAGSPTLYNPENHTYDGHERPLSYIVAPGLYVNDLRQAVGGESKRQGIPPFTLGMTPGPVSGTPHGFEPGDPIEQAIGPDPFKPQAMRAWLFDRVPGAWPSAVFDVGNLGSVQRDAVMKIQGRNNTLEKVAESHDRKTSFGAVMRVNTTTDVGLEFNADVTKAAMVFKQPTRNAPLVWKYGEKPEGHLQPEASLVVDRETGNLVFAGQDVQLSGSVMTGGLSGDDQPARNLRGKNLSLDVGASSIDISFVVPEADADYAVFIEQSWLTNRAVTGKTATGFTVQFAEPAPNNATLDWMIVR